jgi:pimeloyl-ACP methyl ester carboxylesterase
VADAHPYTKAISGSKLVIYANTGHFTHEEVPDQSAADARAFLLANRP